MVNRRKLILLVAETGAGKDTVANKLPYSKVVSYKTGVLRDTDIEGVTHFFISDEQMDELEKRDDLIAWTRTGDIRYCATADQLKEDITVYIINPDGVRWFKENYTGPELEVIVIGLYVPLEERKRRCRNRSDFDTMFMKRVMAEQQDYNIFRLSGEFDYLINNKDSEYTAHVIRYIVEGRDPETFWMDGRVYGK